MSYEEILKVVFPLLDVVELASCMLVCKQWRDVARDDYFWKRFCAKKWPSLGKRPDPPTLNYYKLYQNFYKRQNRSPLPPPRLSFDSLEFFLDIWMDGYLIFSEVIPGSILQAGNSLPPSELSRWHNEGSDYKMLIPVVPRFKVLSSQTLTVSALVGRRDTRKVASVVNKAIFDYIDETARRALAFDYLHLSPEHPFISNVRAWISLLFMEENDGVLDVYGIQIDFCDAANTRDEVLWLLDILDWK